VCYNHCRQFDEWRVERVSCFVVKITKTVRAAMIAHAREARPAECCGLLSGVAGVVTDCHPLRNVADKPETRYFATPEELFAAMRRIRDANQKLLGIYHSHPRTPAYPSASDVEMAFYPEAVYFIISLESQIDLRAYRIDGMQIDSVQVIVEQ
jgi:[CysO sulfur-carrier protein]-S-L-cysteine hydrolase